MSDWKGKKGVHLLVKQAESTAQRAIEASGLICKRSTVSEGIFKYTREETDIMWVYDDKIILLPASVSQRWLISMLSGVKQTHTRTSRQTTDNLTTNGHTKHAKKKEKKVDTIYRMQSDDTETYYIYPSRPENNSEVGIFTDFLNFIQKKLNGYNQVKLQHRTGEVMNLSLKQGKKASVVANGGTPEKLRRIIHRILRACYVLFGNIISWENQIDITTDERLELGAETGEVRGSTEATRQLLRSNRLKTRYNSQQITLPTQSEMGRKKGFKSTEEKKKAKSPTKEELQTDEKPASAPEEREMTQNIKQEPAESDEEEEVEIVDIKQVEEEKTTSEPKKKDQGKEEKAQGKPSETPKTNKEEKGKENTEATKEAKDKQDQQQELKTEKPTGHKETETNKTEKAEPGDNPSGQEEQHDRERDALKIDEAIGSLYKSTPTKTNKTLGNINPMKGTTPSLKTTNKDEKTAKICGKSITVLYSAVKAAVEAKNTETDSATERKDWTKALEMYVTPLMVEIRKENAVTEKEADQIKKHLTLAIPKLYNEAVKEKGFHTGLKSLTRDDMDTTLINTLTQTTKQLSHTLLHKIGTLKKDQMRLEETVKKLEKNADELFKALAKHKTRTVANTNQLNQNLVTVNKNSKTNIQTLKEQVGRLEQRLENKNKKQDKEPKESNDEEEEGSTDTGMSSSEEDEAEARQDICKKEGKGKAHDKSKKTLSPIKRERKGDKEDEDTMMFGSGESSDEEEEKDKAEEKVKNIMKAVKNKPLVMIAIKDMLKKIQGEDGEEKLNQKQKTEIVKKTVEMAVQYESVEDGVIPARLASSLLYKLKDRGYTTESEENLKNKVRFVVKKLGEECGVKVDSTIKQNRNKGGTKRGRDGAKKTGW
jgi:hypothetical protein